MKTIKYIVTDGAESETFTNIKDARKCAAQYINRLGGELEQDAFTKYHGFQHSKRTVEILDAIIDGNLIKRTYTNTNS